MTKIFITSITLLLMFTNLAKAHYSVQDTGELLREHQWQFLTELQFKTSEDTGANGIIRLDKGFNEDSNLRFEFGAGTTDYELGGFYKWVPFPDFDRQPAIGFSIGAHFAHYEDETEMAARFVPFASKKFESFRGDHIPYIAFPMAIARYNDKTYTPIQLVFGTKWVNPDFEAFDLTFELGFELNDSFTYISVGAVFPAFE